MKLYMFIAYTVSQRNNQGTRDDMCSVFSSLPVPPVCAMYKKIAFPTCDVPGVQSRQMLSFRSWKPPRRRDVRDAILVRSLPR